MARKRKGTRKRKKSRSKRRKKSLFSMNPPKRRRSRKRHVVHHRRRSHNPPMGRGIVNLIMNGFIDGGEVLVGRYGTKTIPHLVGMNSGLMGALVELGSAVAVGFMGDKFISKNAGKMLLAGGFSAVAETLIVTYNIPVLAQLTMPVPVAAGAIPAPVASAGTLPAPGVSAYPLLSSYPRGIGDDAEEVEEYGQM